MTNITEKIDKYLNETKDEIISEVKDLLKYYNDECKGKQKCVRQKILDNLVNSKYGYNSNQYIDIAWQEFNKMFPS